MKTLRRTLLLLLLSASVLAGMAVYVKLTQPTPTAPLQVSVDRDILWPWQETELRISFIAEPAPEISTPPAPTDFVFLLDTSGSMSDEDIEEAKRALLEFLRNVAAGQRNARVAVVEFADRTRVISPFTSDYQALVQTLVDMERGAGGGTEFIAGLSKVLELLQGRPGSTTVVMLTDGGASESGFELERFYTQQWRPQGHDLFMLGIGADGVNPASFLRLTDDPSKYIVTGLDRGAIDELFVEAARRLGNVLGVNAELGIPLAEPLWAWSPERARKALDAEFQHLLYTPEITALHALPVLFQRTYRWAAPIEPKLGGILTTLSEPATLSYVGEDNQRQPFSAVDGTPKVLVITPWLLSLLFLPALLYLLAALLERLLRGSVVSPELTPMEPINIRRPPPNLPRRFPANAQRTHWVPALVIGLGGAGRHVLTHLQQALDDSLDHPETRPVLLALDVARDEAQSLNPEPIPACLRPLPEDRLFILPPESCALYDAVHQPRSGDDPAAALDLQPYKNLGVDALRLNKGTHGEAPLARLALLNDFAVGADSALLKRLHTALEEWRQIVPEQNYRQIVLVANVQGGVGSGWLSDLLVLLRRLVVEDEKRHKAVEMVVLLVGDEVWQGRDFVPLKAPTLFDELDRLATAGRQGFRHCLSASPGEAQQLLDGWVGRRPQDAIFVLPGAPETWISDLYPTTADALCLLLDQRRRTELTHALQAVQAGENHRRAAEGRELYTRLSIHNAAFPRSFLRALMAGRLGHLLANEQILFPGLDETNGQLQLQERILDTAVLLERRAISVDDGQFSEEETALDTLCQGALGDRTALEELESAADVLAQATHDFRLLLLHNANRLLTERRLGLAGLSKNASVLGQHLHKLNGVKDRAEVLALADDCTTLANQAAVWIELFLGTDVRRDLDTRSTQVATGRRGFVLDCLTTYQNDLKALREWSQVDSRMLITPIHTGDLRHHDNFEQQLDALFQEFLNVWLEEPSGASRDRLAERCHWEISMPGLGGEAFGVNLVLRGTEVKRYTPAPEELECFYQELRQEAANVLDSVSDFHILELLGRSLEHPDSQGLAHFAERLKGNLRGENSSLLVSLPGIPGGGYDPDLLRLRNELEQTFLSSAGTAELIHTHISNERFRLSVTQTTPLLPTSPRTEPPSKPLHPYELLRRNYARMLADDLQVDRVDIPPVAGIALQDEHRLRQFARWYGAKKIIRRELDDLWYLRDGERQFPLTFLPEQTLADAAAYFVSHELELIAGEETTTEPALPDAQEDDFVALLEWLLRSQADPLAPLEND